MISNDLISRKDLLQNLKLFEEDQVGAPLNPGILYARIIIEAMPGISAKEGAGHQDT